MPGLKKIFPKLNQRAGTEILARDGVETKADRNASNGNWIVKRGSTQKNSGEFGIKKTKSHAKATVRVGYAHSAKNCGTMATLQIRFVIRWADRDDIPTIFLC